MPRSARFDDIYHSSSGALAQARHVFLGGCRIPQAWAGQARWTVLETGFGLGLNFLATWLAWKNDAARAQILHFVSVEAYPVAADDLRRAAQAYPELAGLAEELAAQWHGLLPGVHRLWFERGQVLLTLCIGDAHAQLRTLAHFDADSIFLDGFSPARNPQMWSPPLLKAVARFARRGTRLATWSIARPLRDALTPLGFSSVKAPGLPPKRDRLEALFDPPWTPRRSPASPDRIEAPGHCMVIGAGLAGAAVAASLARRGWQVTVLEAGAHAAAGASGLPVGLMAPHCSPDDALMSRLTRAGIRATWQQLAATLKSGVDWSPTGALERREGPIRMPADWQADGPNESWIADPQRMQAAGLPAQAPAIWHARAAWVRPARLVQAWLDQPGVSLLTQAPVAALSRVAGDRADAWQANDQAGRTLARADRVVIACGVDSTWLAPQLPLHVVRGQVLMGSGPIADGVQAQPHPVNGNGHLITNVPEGDDAFWLAGSTYVRGDTSRELREAETLVNLDRLGELHPGAAAQAMAAHRQGLLRAWAGLRCVSRDRRPLVGPAAPLDPQGPWICTALGSRGLSFAALCAESLAARWHGEPLPLQSALAEALDTRRTA
nr:FAD-dependent 5-carboxymethylaminomethyl-2-thiouridine(34) oxidoreductase MnmC [Variovorax dokdonensis]